LTTIDCKEEEEESPFLHERRKRSVGADLRHSTAPFPTNNGRQHVAKEKQVKEEKLLEVSMKKKIAELEQKIKNLGMMPCVSILMLTLQNSVLK